MITKLAVIGAGQMGSGIAQVCAQAGYVVQLMDISADQRDKAKATITNSLDRLEQKGSLSSQDKETTLNNIQFVEWLDLPETLDLVIEAVSENLSLKTQILQDLDGQLNESAIIATNTSSLSITKLGGITQRPDRVIGMHFMNPVPIMQLVEVIRGLSTSDTTFSEVEALIQTLGKTSVVSQDFPGFIVNRILMPMINEAIFALHEGIASVEDIDTAMKLGTNQPMGPLTLADFIGLDTCLSIMQVLHTGLGDDKYRPCPLLVNYVNAGWLGKKAGRGFYGYDG